MSQILFYRNLDKNNPLFYYSALRNFSAAEHLYATGLRNLLLLVYETIETKLNNLQLL